jgi:hypothetical protein
MNTGKISNPAPGRDFFSPDSPQVLAEKVFSEYTEEVRKPCDTHRICATALSGGVTTGTGVSRLQVGDSRGSYVLAHLPSKRYEDVLSEKS